MNSIENKDLEYYNCFFSHYQSLEKTQGSCLFRKKILLSYDVEKGWSIVKLGWIELFLRKLGFFKSTHLKNVANAWSTLKATTDYSNKTLNNQIKTLWKKNYPQQNYPSYFVAFGNTPPKQASVKLFCEEHGDNQFRKALGKKIDKNHQKNDIFLVEGFSAEKQIRMDEYLGKRYWNSNCIVQGWDIENYYELVQEIFDKQQVAMIKKTFEDFAFFSKKIRDYIGTRKVNAHDMQLIETSLNIYINSLGYLLNYVFSEQKENKQKVNVEFAKIKDFISFNFKIIKRGGENVWDNLAKLNDFVKEKDTSLMQAIEKNLRICKDGEKKIRDTFYSRNVSLSKQIDMQSKPERKVYALMGFLHGLKVKNEPFYIESVNLLHEHLKKHAFVIYASRKIFEKYGMEANQDLNLISFK